MHYESNKRKSTHNRFVMLKGKSHGCKSTIGFIIKEKCDVSLELYCVKLFPKYLWERMLPPLFPQEEEEEVGVGLEKDVEEEMEHTCFVYESDFTFISEVCDIFGEYHLENGVRECLRRQNDKFYILDGIGGGIDGLSPLLVRPMSESESTLMYEQVPNTSYLDINVNVDIGIPERPLSLSLNLVQRGGTGGAKVWDASLFLARWLIEFGLEFIENKCVLELGAGLGLPSLAAAPFAEKIYSTDIITEVLDNLNSNIRNQSIVTAIQDCAKSHASYSERETIFSYCDDLSILSHVEALSLDWFDYEYDSVIRNKIDCLLVAECVYDNSVVLPLISTIGALLAPGGVIVVCMPNARSGASSFIYKMSEIYKMRKLPINGNLRRGLVQNEILETFVYIFSENK